MRYVCVYGISSPSEESNYLTFLRTVCSKSTGERIFSVVQFGFECPECEADGTFAGRCNHPNYVALPAHRDSKMLDIAESLLASDIQSIQQELYGVSMSSHSYLLREFLGEFQRRHQVDGPWVFRDPVQVLHCYVDPSGGGDGSDFAVATMARVRDQYVVVGLSRWHNDRTGNSHVAINRMLKDHWDGIFNLNQYRDAKVWLYWEVQMGSIQSDQYTAWLMGLYPGRFYPYRGVQSHPEQVGVPVNEARKMAWADSILEVMTGQNLSYAADFVTSRIGDLSMEDSIKLVKDQLEDQMHRETVEIRIPPDPFGKVKMVYGAKQGGKKDDLLTCIKGCLCEMRRRLVDPVYRRWCISQGIQRI